MKTKKARHTEPFKATREPNAHSNSTSSMNLNSPLDAEASPDLSPEELTQLVDSTVASYERRAEQFWQGTKDHDVTQNRQAFLEAIQAPTPAVLLDLGCGPGRDLQAFSALGHTTIGLDACESFCQMARDYSGCDVWQQNFLQLNLPANYFHGIFANASLFHVPQQELPRVLGDLHRALKPAGVLFCSNPRGPGLEGWHGERYGARNNFQQWRGFLQQAQFTLIDHYYRPPGKPRDEQPWLVTLWRKSTL